MANEYAVNQADLVAVADVLREKANTAENLVFPNDFVSLISAFNGLPSEIAELSAGVLVPASTGTQYITYGLSQAPHFVVIYAPVGPSNGISSVTCVWGEHEDFSTGYSSMAYAGYAGGSWTQMSRANVSCGIERLSIYTPSLTVGTTYYWVCGVFKTN